jgi:LPS-assembly protein
MRVRTFLFITALMLCHLQLRPQTLTKQFPSATGPSSLPDAPDYPIAEVVAAPPSGVVARLESKQQEKHGNVYILTGEVRIDYKDYTLTADKVSYDDETRDAEADGHVRLQGGRNSS